MMALMLLLLAAAAAAPAAADKVTVPPVLTVHQVETTMEWTLTAGDAEERAEGTIVFRRPYAFQFEFDEEARRDVHYRGITATYQQGRVEYAYEPSTLFSVLEELYIPLTQVLDTPGTWAGEERIDGRVAVVYEQEGPLEGRYWLDQQTGVPLQAEIGGQRYLSLIQYHSGIEEIGEPPAVELAWTRDGFEGTLYLVRSHRSWLPQRLQVDDEDFKLDLQFETWDRSQTSLDLDDIQKLYEYLEQAEDAADDGKWEAAIEAYSQVLRIDPYYTPAYLHIACGYGELGHHLRAIEHYQQWLMLEPGHPVAMNNLAYVYMLQEVRLHEAVRLAEEAVDIQRNPAFLDTLGYGYYLTGQYEKAIPYLEEALESIEDAMRPEVLRHLVKVYEALGDDEQVQHYSEKLEDENG